MPESKLRDISVDFSVKVIKLCQGINGHYSLVNQLERSATSIGANIREAKYAHGKADFVAKLQISLKECYETETGSKRRQEGFPAAHGPRRRAAGLTLPAASRSPSRSVSFFVFGCGRHPPRGGRIHISTIFVAMRSSKRLSCSAKIIVGRYFRIRFSICSREKMSMKFSGSSQI